MFLITFGCDPGEKEIEVKTMTASVNGWKADPYLGDSMFLNGSPSNVPKDRIKVQDAQWMQMGDGTWIGKPFNDKTLRGKMNGPDQMVSFRYAPANGEAVKAIMAYMNK